MFTIPPLRGNGKYYTDLAREDYYTAGGEPRGKWMGQAAPDFELDGRKVTARQFRNVLEGFDPALKKIERDKQGNLTAETKAAGLVQNAGKKNRQSGYDICFSVVKSASVAWSAADPKLRPKMERAAELGFRAGLQYLEENAAFTRRGKGGTEIEKVKLLVAAFPHCTSRAQEPDYHLHGVTPNFGLREDGSTSTLASYVSKDKYGNTETYNPLMRHGKAAGALARCEHAYQLSKLGFEIERSENGFSFDIAGIPKKACEFYSTRRKEIEEHLAEKGFASAKAAEIANKATRLTKDDINRPELFARWQAELKQFGIDQEFIQELASKKHAYQKAKTLDHAITQVSNALGETQGSFAVKELVEGVANQVVADCIPAKAITERIEKEITEGQVVSLGWHHQERRLSTKENIQFEHNFLSSLKRSRDNKEHLLPDQVVDEVLNARERRGEYSLSAEQTRALHYLVTGRDNGKEVGGLRVVVGDAGTGKTTLLKSAKEGWEAGGYKVRGAALAGAAKNKLQMETGIPSHTIAKWNWEQAKRTVRDDWKVDSKTVLVIDETVMADSSALYRLQCEAAKQGALTAFIGDEKQCQSIGHGGAFIQATRMTQSVRLTENFRQKDEQDRKVAALQAKGHSAEALRNLGTRGRVRVEASERKTIERLVKDWTKNGGARDPSHHHVICATHKQRLELNSQLQWERLNAVKRALGGYVTNHEEQKLYAGDRVNFRETISFVQRKNSLLNQVKTEAKYAVNQVTGKELFNAPNGKTERQQVTRGSFGTVVALNPLDATIKISMDDGRLLDVPLYKKSKPDRKLFPTPKTFQQKEKTHIALGYATTTHVSQGGSFREIYSLAGGTIQDRELSYVQMTRGVEKTNVYTSFQLAGEELTLLASLQDAREQGDTALSEALEKKLELATKNKDSSIEQSLLARQMTRSRQKDFALSHVLNEDEPERTHTR